MNPLSDPTISGLLTGAVTALSGVIVYLWRQLSSHYAELKADHNECKKDREELWKAMYSIHPAAQRPSAHNNNNIPN